MNIGFRLPIPGRPYVSFRVTKAMLSFFMAALAAAFLYFAPFAHAATLLTGADCKLLKANSGTDATITANTVDTLALSGLTSTDYLDITTTLYSLTQSITGNAQLYSTTDSLELARVGAASWNANRSVFAHVIMTPSVHSSTEIMNMTIKNDPSSATNAGPAVSTFTGLNGSVTTTTAWTGSWTLGLRHGAITSGGSLEWKWAVYKCSSPSTDSTAYLTVANNLSDVNSASTSLANLSGVPTSRTVNGHALSSDVTVTKSDVGLGSVENTALSTWAGSTNLATLGTITSGVWNGTVVTVPYGGTSLSSITSGSIMRGNGTSAPSLLAFSGSATDYLSGAGTWTVPPGTGSGLPANAAGFLENDGAGSLSWSTPAGTLPPDSPGALVNDGSGGLSWINDPSYMFDAMALLLLIGGSAAIFLAVAFWRNGSSKS